MNGIATKDNEFCMILVCDTIILKQSSTHRVGLDVSGTIVEILCLAFRRITADNTLLRLAELPRKVGLPI